MRLEIITLSLIAVLVACKSSDTMNTNQTISVDNDMRANLLDGNWKPDFIMNSPNSIEEMFPGEKPSVTFNSREGTVNGFAGCNNFNGKFKLNGNIITWDEGMATTKKMCPSMEAEKSFLETLQKANSFSVTNRGQTLNLVMGDIAVMRLRRN